MAAEKRVKRSQSRGRRAKTQSSERLADVINETLRLWRKHHLGYDQTKYVVERVRRRLALEPPRTRNRTVERLDRGEVEHLVHATYQHHSTYGLMIKVLFQTGARVAELRYGNDSPENGPVRWNGVFQADSGSLVATIAY